MRISARLFFAVLVAALVFFFRSPAVFAQTTDQPSPSPIVSNANNTSSNINNFLSPNVESNVPQNHHEYTQIVLIDLLSALMCQVTGIDPTNPNQACLGVDATTGKIGMIPATTQFGQAQSPQQIGGALGMMTNYISSLYIPAVSTSDYTHYLASNFGIVHNAYAAGPTKCAANTFGYGFCGLSPIFTLWTGMRDFAYALLTILFIAIGIGVMLRFKVDPRTVMTLQNQIPRVIIAIILITFSYAIAGGLIDLMWTVTYAGINFISQNSTSKITLCPNTKELTLSQGVEQRLIDQPLSFVNTIYRDTPGCDHTNNGLLTLSEKVTSSLGTLVTEVVKDMLNLGGGCSFNLNPLHDLGCVATNAFGQALIWVSEQLVKLVILIILLVALFRLWFQLIKTYLTFIIFVILGPLWIVLGLIPGRPMGFEKWLRIIFTNLAIFPLVAFVLVFGRVIVDAVPQINPQNVFIPPLIGNPSVSTFNAFMGLGTILIAQSLPDLIRERMKAKGQTDYGKIASAGAVAGMAVATSPAKKAWGTLTRRNPTTGEPEGPVSILRQRAWEKTPMGRKATAKRRAAHRVWAGGDERPYSEVLHEEMENVRKRATRGGRQEAAAARAKAEADKAATERGGSATERAAAAMERAAAALERKAGSSGSGSGPGGPTT